MTPATARKATTSRRKKGEAHEVAVAGSTSKKVTVKPSGGRVMVTWHCGTSRSFKPEELRPIIELVDGFATDYPETWVNPEDSNRQIFFFRLDKTQKKVTASTVIEDNSYVSWLQLKRALQATIAELALDD